MLYRDQITKIAPYVRTLWDGYLWYPPFSHVKVKIKNILPMMVNTVCSGSSDPPEEIFDIFASENEGYNIY